MYDLGFYKIDLCGIGKNRLQINEPELYQLSYLALMYVGSLPIKMYITLYVEIVMKWLVLGQYDGWMHTGYIYITTCCLYVNAIFSISLCHHTASGQHIVTWLELDIYWCQLHLFLLPMYNTVLLYNNCISMSTCPVWRVWARLATATTVQFHKVCKHKNLLSTEISGLPETSYQPTFHKVHIVSFGGQHTSQRLAKKYKQLYEIVPRNK